MCIFDIFWIISMESDTNIDNKIMDGHDDMIAKILKKEMLQIYGQVKR